MPSTAKKSLNAGLRPRKSISTLQHSQTCSSVGVMGDERTYDYAVALRAVKTNRLHDCRDPLRLPYEVLNKVMNRIINEVKGSQSECSMIVTSKPPGTIEFE